MYANLRDPVYGYFTSSQSVWEQIILKRRNINNINRTLINHLILLNTVKYKIYRNVWFYIKICEQAQQNFIFEVHQTSKMWHWLDDLDLEIWHTITYLWIEYIYCMCTLGAITKLWVTCDPYHDHRAIAVVNHLKTV